MRIAHTATFLVVSVLFGVFLAAALPEPTLAVGTAADAMCTPVFQQCPCGQKPNPQGNPPCIPGPNMFMCPCFDVTNKFQTMGQCISMLTCKATGTSDGKGPDQGLSKLGEMLGQLLQQMMKKDEGGGQPPGGTPTTPTGSTGCTGTPFQTSDVSQLTNPCAQYVPQNPITDPIANPNATCDAMSQLLGTCNTGTNSNTNPILTTPSSTTKTCAPVSVGCTAGFTAKSVSGTDAQGCALPMQCVPLNSNATSSGPAFAATPASGKVPLSVVFAAIRMAPGTYSIDVGDGSGGIETAQQSCGADGCAYAAAYVYIEAGSYSAKLQKDGQTIAVATVQVAPGSATSIIGGKPSANAGQGFGSLGELTAGAPPFSNSLVVLSRLASGNPDLLGSFGDFRFFNGGVTLYGGTTTGNRGISSFYGQSNGNPQGLAAGLCKARPWTLISAILPTSFFDNLCIKAGYGPQAVKPQTPVVQLQQKPSVPATTTRPTQTVNVPQGIQPKVSIWAVPQTVQLNSRTSIFWTTQGVRDCTVTSPDGSFEQHSLSGGASTVPLVAATVFSISCLDNAGNPVTSYTTVQLAI